MKTYTYLDSPVKIYGVPFFETRKTLKRLPDELIEKIPNLNFLGRRSPGVRMCFRTNSKTFTVKIEFETLSPDIGMAIYSCQSAFVYAGDRAEPRYLGLVNPPDYNTKSFSRVFDKKSTETEDIIIYLPRNEIMKNIEVEIEDDAEILPPTPYKYEKPIVYYGSSITEGGCCCNMSNAYNAIISKHLSTNYINLGFSGNALGEPEMADFINTIDMSIFVLDYDHNAPTPEHLENTHYPFYKKIRSAHPELPILMLTRPAEYTDEDVDKRREIVNATYERAKAAGDNNVYFIDGSTYFGEKDRDLCTIDTTHPNDYGFHLMAAAIEPTIKEILEKL